LDNPKRLFLTIDHGKSLGASSAGYPQDEGAIIQELVIKTFESAQGDIEGAERLTLLVLEI
jgi:hypothetical protein